MKQEIIPASRANDDRGRADIVKLSLAHLSIRKSEVGLEKAQVDLNRAKVTSAASVQAGRLKVASAGIDAVQTIVSDVVGYYSKKLDHEREMAEINTEAVARLELIAAKREVLLRHLDDSFKERKLSLNAFINGLDCAITAGDADMVGKLAEQIVEVVRAPVLSRAAEAVKALESGETITFGGRRR